MTGCSKQTYDPETSISKFHVPEWPQMGQIATILLHSGTSTRKQSNKIWNRLPANSVFIAEAEGEKKAATEEEKEEKRK